MIKKEKGDEGDKGKGEMMVVMVKRKGNVMLRKRMEKAMVIRRGISNCDDE